MGKAYSNDQRQRVRTLLEEGRDEETIEKETGVSDRTIRRWKLDLERTGRIGKPPEARTGRHRALSADMEQALFEHVRLNPAMTVDDMLWWLYEIYGVVVGTRTIRRVFERKGKGSSLGKGRKTIASAARRDADANHNADAMNVDRAESNDVRRQEAAPLQPSDEDVDRMHEQNIPAQIESQLRRAMEQIGSGHVPTPPPAEVEQSESMPELNPELQQPQEETKVAQAQPAEESLAHDLPAHDEALDLDGAMPEDPELVKLQLQQIALQKREVELKLKLRKLQDNAKGASPISIVPTSADPPSHTDPSPLYDPLAAIAHTPPKRDSRSKKKIEESRRRTAARQERMLKDLERRSRRRDHLTAEWVQSKDIWPLRAQSLLADLMHQFGCYTWNSNAPNPAFEAIFRELHMLIDFSTGEWDPAAHDDMLRERMKRKMSQLRNKMQKTGEIIGRQDAYGGFQRAIDYTGEQAGASSLMGDDTEMMNASDLDNGELQHDSYPQYDRSDIATAPMQPSGHDDGAMELHYGAHQQNATAPSHTDHGFHQHQPDPNLHPDLQALYPAASSGGYVAKSQQTATAEPEYASQEAQQQHHNHLVPYAEAAAAAAAVQSQQQQHQQQAGKEQPPYIEQDDDRMGDLYAQPSTAETHQGPSYMEDLGHQSGRAENSEHDAQQHHDSQYDDQQHHDQQQQQHHDQQQQQLHDLQQQQDNADYNFDLDIPAQEQQGHVQQFAQQNGEHLHSQDQAQMQEDRPE